MFFILLSIDMNLSASLLGASLDLKIMEWTVFDRRCGQLPVNNHVVKVRGNVRENVHAPMDIGNVMPLNVNATKTDVSIDFKRQG